MRRLLQKLTCRVLGHLWVSMHALPTLTRNTILSFNTDVEMTCLRCGEPVMSLASTFYAESPFFRKVMQRTKEMEKADQDKEQQSK